MSCLEDCNCDVGYFYNGDCLKYRLPLRYIRRDSGAKYTTFFKVGTTSVNTTGKKPQVLVVTGKKPLVLILVVTSGFAACSCVALAICGIFTFEFRVVKYRRLLGLTGDLTLRSFSYNELKKVTNGFKHQLGKGSFGTVYKGTLHKGKRPVAVKRLEKLVNEGEREFQAEIRVIGRTHHRNLVRLLGYCAQDSKRLLVYEYMPNGSLADLLFGNERRPDWNDRVRMALDIARGILYLHEECDAPIIHCDIKPQNILMDDLWTAKISDFGLSKLLMPDQTRTFTGVRGTRGYLAPEWQNNVPISVKADIYSYGVMLLEIVCCRRNIDVNVSKPEEIVLSNWVYNCFVTRALEKVVGGEEVDKITLEKMVKVGLWCIQDEPPLRPSIKSIVLMLEGMADISAPPCPITASM